MSLFKENFVMITAEEADEQHDNRPRSQVPFSLMVKGPPTIRRRATGSGRKAYVVTRGGDLDLVIEETVTVGGGSFGG